jgi:hypothetical protein
LDLAIYPAEDFLVKRLMFPMMDEWWLGKALPIVVFSLTVHSDGPPRTEWFRFPMYQALGQRFSLMGCQPTET